MKSLELRAVGEIDRDAGRGGGLAQRARLGVVGDDAENQRRPLQVVLARIAREHGDIGARPRDFEHFRAWIDREDLDARSRRGGEVGLPRGAFGIADDDRPPPFEVEKDRQGLQRRHQAG